MHVLSYYHQKNYYQGRKDLHSTAFILEIMFAVLEMLTHVQGISGRILRDQRGELGCKKAGETLLTPRSSLSTSDFAGTRLPVVVCTRNPSNPGAEDVGQSIQGQPGSHSKT